jgi:hypothetical protein
MKACWYFAVICSPILAMNSCSAPKANVIYLKDYLTEDSSKDAMPAIRKALDDCKKMGASELVLPGDTLRILPYFAYEEFQYISNNDPSMKKIAFQLRNMKNFAVKGNGTMLLFSGHISPFNLEGCSNVSFENFCIDFTRAFVSEGVVTASGDGFFELEFPENYKAKLVQGNLRFWDELGEEYPYSNMLEFDSKLKEVAYHAHDYWLGGDSYPAGQVGEKRYRFYRKDFGEATVGNIMVLGASTRNNPAFTLLDCDKVSFTDVSIYNCCGMGVIAQSSRDIDLTRMVVEPTPGSDRIISISADATHFVNCKGHINMIDCIFKNQKDDATNIHGWYMQVDSLLGPDRVLLRWRNSGQYGVDFIKKGMHLAFEDYKTLRQTARLEVKDVEVLNSLYTEVSFTEPLPSGLKVEDVAAEDDEYPDVLISGCYIGNNRARGLLIGSRGHVVIEKNTFHTAGSAILFEGDGRYWYEQSGVKDVIIRDNLFENCMYGAASWGSAVIAVGSGIYDKENSRYHSGIVVENNTFRGFDTRIVNLYCVDGFTFRNNKIESSDDYPSNGDQSEIMVEKYCDNIKF